MKTRIQSIGVASIVIATVLVCVAAISPAVKPLTPYEREQTKGNVRVVLLKVERATIFTSDGIENPEKGKIYPGSYFGVTYLVEALGNDPATNWLGSSADMVIGGKPVGDDQLLPNNVNPGNYLASFNLKAFGAGAIEIPKVANRERCIVMQYLDRLAKSPNGTLQVTIKAGFNKQTEVFVFDRIPVI